MNSIKGILIGIKDLRDLEKGGKRKGVWTIGDMRAKTKEVVIVKRRQD